MGLFVVVKRERERRLQAGVERIENVKSKRAALNIGEKQTADKGADDSRVTEKGCWSERDKDSPGVV